MNFEHGEIRDTPTAAQQHYIATDATTRGHSLPHERFGIRKLFEFLGKPEIVLKLWDGFSVGEDAGDSIGTVTFRNRSVFYKMLFFGEVAFGDGYSVGSIKIDGNLVDMLLEFVTSRRKLGHIKSPFAWTPSTWLPASSYSGHERENIHHHYDVGNSFYRLWLDEEMQYTCAYFPDPNMSLEAAQQAKMDHVCRKLQLQPGDRVAEAGCGWGSLARHMAKYYGAKVTAYNISHEQISFASNRARSEGYADQVQYVEDDYRNICGEFDVFVSVGMLEHVGPKNYRALGKVVDATLSSDGRALIHSIGRNIARPMSPWIEKRIFPGAYPPTLREMMDILEPNYFSVLDIENLRLHYARTLEHWLQRFENSSADVVDLFDEQFVHAWRLYLSGSIAAFLAGGLQLFQIVFTRDTNNIIPWSREHLY